MSSDDGGEAGFMSSRYEILGRIDFGFTTWKGGTIEKLELLLDRGEGGGFIGNDETSLLPLLLGGSSFSSIIPRSAIKSSSAVTFGEASCGTGESSINPKRCPMVIISASGAVAYDISEGTLPKHPPDNALKHLADPNQ